MRVPIVISLWLSVSVSASVRLERNFTVPRFDTFTKLTPTVHLQILDMIYRCHVVICVPDLYFTPEWALLGRNGKYILQYL